MLSQLPTALISTILSSAIWYTGFIYQKGQEAERNKTEHAAIISKVDANATKAKDTTDALAIKISDTLVAAKDSDAMMANQRQLQLDNVRADAKADNRALADRVVKIEEFVIKQSAVNERFARIEGAVDSMARTLERIESKIFNENTSQKQGMNSQEKAIPSYRTPPVLHPDNPRSCITSLHGVITNRS
jgi:hypothetical protein